MSLMVDNSKTYLRQMEESEVQKEFWTRLAKLSGYIWRQGQTRPYELKKLQQTGPEQLTVSSDDFSNKTMQQDFIGISVFLKFKSSDEVQYFASGQLTQGDGKEFTVQLAPPYFVTTKRATCRYLTTPTDRITLTVAGHTFASFDISSGGFSTEVRRDQYGGLSKGSAFEQVVLKYNLKNYTIPTVKLVNIIDVIGQPDKVRLAFKFEGLKPQEEDALWVEVNKSIKKLVDLMGQ